MGKRTLRTLHFEMVASVLRLRIDGVRRYREFAANHTGNIGDYQDDYIGGRQAQLVQLVLDFADEFEMRAEGFDRERFVQQCGVKL